MPAAPPSSAASGTPASRSPASSSATSQPAALSPKVVGSACWSRRAAGHERVAVLVREPGARRRRGVQVRPDERERVARHEHRRRVHHVLARRAAVDVAGAVALHRARERLDERRGRVAGRARLAAELLGVEARRVRAAAAIASAASAGITPARAGRRASAASKRSIASTQARSDTAARMASGRNSAPKRALDVKEDGLALALQADVEAQHRRHHRAPPAWRAARARARRARGRPRWPPPRRGSRCAWPAA